MQESDVYATYGSPGKGWSGCSKWRSGHLFEKNRLTEVMTPRHMVRKTHCS